MELTVAIRVMQWSFNKLSTPVAVSINVAKLMCCDTTKQSVCGRQYIYIYIYIRFGFK